MDKAFRKIIERKPSPRYSNPNENIGVRYNSEVVDIVHYPEGRTEVIDHGHNVMLDSFLPLITNLLASGKGKLLYWALGTGYPEWDNVGKKEVVTFTFTSECTRTGTVQIKLNSTPVDFVVNKGDSTTTIASTAKSFLQSNAVLGSSWDFDVNVNSVICTAVVEGKKTGTHSYSAGDTGALGNVSYVAGQTAGKRPEPTHNQIGTIYQKSGTTGKCGIFNEFYRKKIEQGTGIYADDGIHFLDDNGQISTTPTNILEIKLTFKENEGLIDGEDAPWRCFGIVGGDGASTTLGSGLFMNAKNHAVITKTKPVTNEKGEIVSGMVVERKIKFTFTNADITSTNS